MVIIQSSNFIEDSHLGSRAIWSAVRRGEIVAFLYTSNLWLRSLRTRKQNKDTRKKSDCENYLLKPQFLFLLLLLCKTGVINNFPGKSRYEGVSLFR